MVDPAQDARDHGIGSPSSTDSSEIEEMRERAKDAQTQTSPGPSGTRARGSTSNDSNGGGTELSIAAARDSSHDEKASNRTSFSHVDPVAGFAHTDGDVGGSGYNETKVDIVTVPCPGADPVETWARDPLPDDFFGQQMAGFDHDDADTNPAVALAGNTVLSPGLDRPLPRAATLWVRQGIRKFISTARVLLYRHRELEDGVRLDSLADDLLEHVWKIRQGPGLKQSRPLFFIAHGIGGLVVKKAIVKASRSDKYRGLWYNCHGLTFFGEHPCLRRRVSLSWRFPSY